MNSVYQSVKQLINNLDLTIYVCSVSSNLVKCSNTLYLKNGDSLNDGLGNIYEIADLIVNKEFRLIGNAFNGDKLYFEDVRLPTYLTGKDMSVNNEFQQISPRTRNKVPLAWLVTGFKEELDRVEEPMIYSDIKMFFLSDTDEPKWLTEEHYNLVISRMRNLAVRLLGDIKKNPRFEYSRAGITGKERFGVIVGGKDKDSMKIIDEDLSGVLLELNLRITKDC